MVRTGARGSGLEKRTGDDGETTGSSAEGLYAVTVGVLVALPNSEEVIPLSLAPHRDWALLERIEQGIQRLLASSRREEVAFGLHILRLQDRLR